MERHALKIIHRINSFRSIYSFHIENDFIVKIFYVEIIPRILGTVYALHCLLNAYYELHKI